ncbi:hypothetical protein DFA_11308 [Cavenderia fasciculata]|uniref:Thioesterase domain-containing protein n=1 Tax=Cavenderia fasciculata TaxID=261658 RepID=F4QC60_CACFS|nr:uncharacterized protein DFA_11308 [Cavenderia fasciculata]EGG13547.1 hypothetical protein DFA_11308 [Cavenderia fasciculata]|eukprot:XP_004350251.1 hypothetical protein DFA_11308 [Cavenderia fasciculata]
MTSFWQALKTMFIAIGMNHQQQAQNSHSHKSSKSGTTSPSSERRSKSLKRSGSGSRKNSSSSNSSSGSSDCAAVAKGDATHHHHHHHHHHNPLNNSKDHSNGATLDCSVEHHNQDSTTTTTYHSGDYMDENTIEWPQWAVLLSQRHDLQPISRNQMDNDEKRKENGFKGKNYVYQDRKFFSKYYWKGFSTINRDQQQMMMEHDQHEKIQNRQQQQRLLSPNLNNKQQGNSNMVQQNTSSPISLTESGNHIVLDYLPDRMLVGVVYWSNNCEGPPGCVHGGALATLFDDSMACCIRYYYNNNYEEDQQQSSSSSSPSSSFPSPSSSPSSSSSSNVSSTTNCSATTTTTTINEPKPKKYAVTANLSVNYKKFVPLNSVSLIETRIERRDGKKIYVHSCIKDQSGSIRAESTAIWIIVNLISEPSSSTNSSFPSSPALASTSPISSPSTPNILNSPRDTLKKKTKIIHLNKQ